MQRSNTYIILFSAVLTIILGGLLSVATIGLRPVQLKAEEIATKKQILTAVMDMENVEDILGTYDRTINSYVIDARGAEVTKDEEGLPVTAEGINLAKEYKKTPDKRLYPVFEYHEENQPDVAEAYIFALYGSGLWDNIWGYVALDIDMNTIVGAVFDHEAETPGLGARITEKEVQGRFKGKKILNEEGMIFSVFMLKAESNPASLIDDHHVNGLSGASITTKGVNRMLKEYLECYQPFIEKYRKSNNEKTAL